MSSKKVRVYTPSSPLREPRKLLADMGQDVLSAQGLAWRLAVRDISAKYRQSFLGITWAFLPPIVAGLMFVLLNGQGVIAADTGDVPYPVFVMAGTLLWQTFVDSLNAPLRVVTKNKNMLSKINFPHEALLLSGLGEPLLNLGIRVLILVGVFMYFGVAIQAAALLGIGGMLALVLLGTVIGTALTPIGVLYTDIRHSLTVVTSLWLFLSPVAYPADKGGLLGDLMAFNPVTHVLDGARDLFINGTMTNPESFWIVVGASLAVSILMWLVYRVSLPILVERMNA